MILEDEFLLQRVRMSLDFLTQDFRIAFRKYFHSLSNKRNDSDDAHYVCRASFFLIIIIPVMRQLNVILFHIYFSFTVTIRGTGMGLQLC